MSNSTVSVTQHTPAVAHSTTGDVMAQEPTVDPAPDDHVSSVEAADSAEQIAADRATAQTTAQVTAEVAGLQAEVAELRRGRTDPTRVRELEHRIAAQASSMATLSAQNERLVRTLKDARSQIVNLKAEVDRLAQPPNAYGLVLEQAADGVVDILTSGRKMRVAVGAALEAQVVPGREVMLNEALNIVAVKGYEKVGEVVLVKEILDDDRVLVVAHADEERVCRRAETLRGEHIRVGDALTIDHRSGVRLRTGA